MHMYSVTYTHVRSYSEYHAQVKVNTLITPCLPVHVGYSVQYSDARKQWEEERQKLRHSKDELSASVERDQVRVRELTNLQETLANSEDVQKKRLAEMY